jgi:hypothetical protein
MGNLINLVALIKGKKKVVDQKQLDMAASYACLERCLRYIEMNNLPELKDLKTAMYRTMKILGDKKK